MHSLGLYHQRINPDTVIITPNGNVKIVGLLIEAALRPAAGTVVHGADTPELVDVTDLGRLLYACLVARWPGGPAYSLPDAPGGRPPLGDPAAGPGRGVAGPGRRSATRSSATRRGTGPAPITTAHDLVVALTKVLGPADASGDLERRLRQPIPRGRGRGASRSTSTTGAPPVSALLDQSPEPAVTAQRPRPPAHDRAARRPWSPPR